MLTAPFVCLHAGSAIHTFMMNTAARLGDRLDLRIQVRSFNAVCRMVTAGVGIGMVLLSSVPPATARQSCTTPTTEQRATCNCASARALH